MDKIQDLYIKSKKYNHYSLALMIEYLVFERKVLKMEDSEEKLNYYLQDRFANKMNEYLREYKEKKR